ncbi:unnamed protein product [Sphagnum troendelagicum]
MTLKSVREFFLFFRLINVKDSAQLADFAGSSRFCYSPRPMYFNAKEQAGLGGFCQLHTPRVCPDSLVRGTFYLTESARGSLAPAESRIMAPPNQTPLRPIPVYVMLPLHILDSQNNEVNYKETDPERTGEEYKVFSADERPLRADLQCLKDAGVQGVMVDCWWGIVEAKGPGQYNWKGYQNLFSIVKAAELELHVVMSFHACVENGVETIPLPGWVKSIGQEKDLFYKDAHDNPSTEYLSWAVDKKPVLKDQIGHRVSPLQVYEKFMSKFKESMAEYLPGTITVIEVGLGPSGELRYPAYRLPWKIPGVGEFQCYDKYMMESWKNEAEEQGFTIPCCVGPQTAGDYNSTPEQTQFFGTDFTNGICYSGTYGKTFLTWYSKNLVDHGQRVLKSAYEIFNPKGIKIAAKVPGIHWCYGTKSHAAEATAGLFAGDSGNNLFVYDSIVNMLKNLQADTPESLKATFIFTCAEMKDDSNKTDKPQTLVMQVLRDAQPDGVFIACENGSEAYDMASYNRIIGLADTFNISYFTYMRLEPELMKDQARLELFRQFVTGMNARTPIKSPEEASPSAAVG